MQKSRKHMAAPRGGGTIDLQLRFRTKDGVPFYRDVRLRAAETAAIVCDMWDVHWCKAASARVNELAPRIDAVVDALRQKGVLIVHSPSETMQAYADHPARKAALAAPACKTETALADWMRLDPEREGSLPIDDADEGCFCEPPCTLGQPWRSQIASVEIRDGDFIADGLEAIYLLTHRGIRNVLFMGVHENMCVLGRPFGIRQLATQGFKVALFRDLTDTMYNPRRPPFVDHFSGTSLVTEHIERHWCPTTTSNQIVGGEPFRFAGDHRRLGADGEPVKVPSKTQTEPDYSHASTRAMERWKDLKFGLRIHWGVYSIDPVGPESWPLSREDLAFQARYHGLPASWNPGGFDANEWMGLMKRAGLKFFVFTTKHHEGFCMVETATRVTRRFAFDAPGKIEPCELAYSIMETPFKRDVAKELVEAARAAGIVPGLYFSHIDWYDADFRVDEWHPQRDPSYSRESDPEGWERMAARHREQIREILTNYGSISELSLDMSMPDAFWPDMVETIKAARRLQPDCLFRNRGIGPYGDYHTPEGWIPDSPESKESPLPWQVIYPLARWMSYDPDASQYKPGSWVVETLVDTAAKGGLFMVGFGPDRDGGFHPKAVEAVEFAGKWLEVNGEAIFRTRPWRLWKEGDAVRFTCAKDRRRLYAICLKWPGKELVLPSVRAKEGSRVFLLGRRRPLTWRNDPARGLTIAIPDDLQDESRRPCGTAYAFKIALEEGGAR